MKVYRTCGVEAPESPVGVADVVAVVEDVVGGAIAEVLGAGTGRVPQLPVDVADVVAVD
jgi:hypothetical protein